MLNSGASLAQAMREVHMPIARLVVVVGTVALLLLAPFCATAQEKNHVTSEQVTRAIQELEQLAEKQIRENALPGLAIAVVFQDKIAYAKGFGVRDVNTKAHSFSARLGFQINWVDRGGRACR